jgi:two-component system, OmpR family, phosphate regulon sensor histidine kinase PhoR
VTADVFAVVLAAGIGIGIVVALAAERLRRRTEPPVEHSTPSPSPYDDDRTRLVLAALPFAAFLVDERGFVRFINTGAERLFRLDAGKSLGQGMIAVVPSIVLERQVLAAIAGAASTRDVVIGDRSRELTLGVTAYPYERGAVVIAADRSDLVALENVRREFVGNVSHELRTPLSAMKLMIETVLLSDDDVEARTLFLPQIAHEIERMIRLVEDLLELARSESGNLTLRREPFDLTEVATAVVNTFAGRSSSLGVELELEAPEAVFVDADRHRLTQVALNLVDNALRHTPAGGVVTIEIGRDGGAALLRVRDTGSGIPYADLPHIFERFYVVDRSRSREHGGTGLGLSIARHLIELHGGTIVVDSTYGSGATFVCRLPVLASPPKIKTT